MSVDAHECVQYKYSARARSPVVVVKLTEEAFLRGLLQQFVGAEGGGGGNEDGDNSCPVRARVRACV